MRDRLNPQELDTVVTEAVTALENGRTHVLQMAAEARQEYESILQDLGALKRQIKAQEQEVDSLVIKEREAKETVRAIHARFHDHTEAEVADAHAIAAGYLGDLRAARVQEQALRGARHALEKRLQFVSSLVERADTLLGELGAALPIFTANCLELKGRLETAQQSRALGLHVIRAQEEERRRLAREIHDGPAQLLNSVVLRIDVCQRLSDTDLNRLRQELQQLKDLVRLSLQDVRKVIFDLRPMALDDLGLVPALRAYLKDFKVKTDIDVELHVDDLSERFTPTFEVAIFRLAQEALNNVQKHAGATGVRVSLSQKDGRLFLTIEDDGHGFEPEQVRQVPGGTFGLMGMQERAELLGGTMKIESGIGQGTRLLFTFPPSD